MPTSFQALHDETRPLALLEPETPSVMRTRVLPIATVLAVLAAILVLVV